MGKCAEEVLELKFEELGMYLRKNHSIFMQYGGKLFYLTDCNDNYWRAQDTEKLNEKGHFVDASELVPSLNEFLNIKFYENKNLKDMFEEANFFASI
ncbi:MAG: hypothetical protein HUJ63_00665 [Enterococcus sp.]|nr:hypothetical protein [Enterococcus sp.]